MKNDSKDSKILALIGFGILSVGLLFAILSVLISTTGSHFGNNNPLLLIPISLFAFLISIYALTKPKKSWGIGLLAASIFTFIFSFILDLVANFRLNI